MLNNCAIILNSHLYVLSLHIVNKELNTKTMREQADKFDNRNPENEGMEKDLEGFDLVADTLQGYFVTVRETQEIFIINHPELDNIEISLYSPRICNSLTIEATKEGMAEIYIMSLGNISSCKNITPEVVQAWFTTLLFKLEN